ncbi:MAG: hypothetical protein LBM01_03745 [Christensenellaceae bacterium]|jgi:hypothetical protein|nr:hypothetical protein [Christensenellaceae bacterium]
MVNENIFYIDAKTKIVDFLSTEFAETFPAKLQNRLLNFFPSMTNYEEEGKRYRPTIFFTNNIDTVVKTMPNAIKIELFSDENENMFASRLKSLIPFCGPEWCIYINYGATISYGIFKVINSIKDDTLQDIIFAEKNMKLYGEKTYGIYIYAENNWTVSIRGIKGRNVNINFALDIKTVTSWDNEIQEFVDATFSKLKTTAKKAHEIKTMYKNIFKNVARLINGTICVIVDKDYVRDEFFEDGIWLKEPINLSKLFIQTTNYNEQKLLSMSNLFMSMLSFDGITIINNVGEVLAYNVFIEANLKTSGNIIGGARKRATYTVINSRRKNIIGVYFQSHDGEIFYAPVKK